MARESKCFNPCCIGLAIAGALWASYPGRSGGFQSLLYWISHCGHGSHYTHEQIACVSILVVLD